MKMYDENDTRLLKQLKNMSAKKRRTFNNAINSRDLTDEEMDEWFLGE